MPRGVYERKPKAATRKMGLSVGQVVSCIQTISTDGTTAIKINNRAGKLIGQVVVSPDGIGLRAGVARIAPKMVSWEMAEKLLNLF